MASIDKVTKKDARSLQKREVIVFSCSKDEDEFSVHDESNDLTLENSTSIKRNDVEDVVVDDFVIFNFAIKTNKFIYFGRTEKIHVPIFNCMKFKDCIVQLGA